jgi:hypothetical protein
MLDTSGYTVGSNQPLTRARILYAPITGTVTAGGAGGALAANDFTFQRWDVGPSPSNWTLVTVSDAEIDTVFIAAHSLAGTTVLIQTAATVGGAFVTRATLNPTDNSTIAVMLNDMGDPYVIRELRIAVSGGTGFEQVGVIRAGVALQMTQAVYGGVQPIGLNRIVETRHAISETGQWLGRTIQRQARRTAMPWTHLKADWYRSTFEPFALSLPQTPFGLIQNPAEMPESAAWCWTDESPTPSNMGVRDYMEVTLNITGFLE